MIRWVFLDRDGTLNVKPPDGQYIEHPSELELLPGAGESVRMLNDSGLWTGVVTNQRGIALGRMSLEDLGAVNRRLGSLLGLHNAHLDALYACPHGLDECLCRKPEPGMLLQAQADHPMIDFANAAIVGDSANDVLAGRQLGLTTILIDVEPGAEGGTSLADHVVPDLLHAAKLLTARS